MRNDFEILDCTLRDGGYYTNWDFDQELVIEYFKGMEILPIDYVEIGYRSKPLDDYLGEFFYCPEYVMKLAKKLMPNKKLTIILDEKNTDIADLDLLLDPCKPYITMVRMAIAPQKLKDAIVIAKVIKQKGFEVGFNVMYMSNWKNNKEFFELLPSVNDVADVFYMVDSYGGVTPDEVKEIYHLVSEKLTIPVAFHGHNNLEFAHINTLTAINCGCKIVDATITGMGRGAGNLKTELLLTYLTSIKNEKLAINELSSIVHSFQKLQRVYNWGTNLPYMFSGANSLPQKEVMTWMGLNRYPLSTIITALKNQKEEVSDNIRLPEFKIEKKINTAIIIGGGQSVLKHQTAVKRFVKSFDNTCLIHAGVRYSGLFRDLNEIKQFYCLVGSEAYKLSKSFEDLSQIKNKCIFPPYPRKMGTILPQKIEKISYELENISFVDKYEDSPLTIALESARVIDAQEIILIGFDGYELSKDKTQFQLANENQYVLDAALKEKFMISSATQTAYKNIPKRSLFSYLK